jgi:hypothetical protein
MIRSSLNSIAKSVDSPGSFAEIGAKVAEEHDKRSTNGSLDDPDCLGPCYPANTIIVHPLILQYVTNTKHPFCPIKPWRNRLKRGALETTKACSKPTPAKLIDDAAVQMNFITPKLTFDPRKFLSMYYNVFTYDNVNRWYYERMEKGTIPPWATVRRVFDCAIRVYGLEKFKNELDDVSLDTIQAILRQYWADKIVEKSELPLEEVLQLFDIDSLRKIVAGYVSANEAQWNSVPSHCNVLRAACIHVAQRHAGKK